MTENQHEPTGEQPLRPFTMYSGNVKENTKGLELERLTAIVGEEASYKSAIGIGIRLALTGEYEAVGKLPSKLISLAADRGVGLDCHLSGPDGDFHWTMAVDPKTGDPKKPSAPVTSNRLRALSEDERACIIPMDSVRDLLKNAKGDKKRREAFLLRFGGGLKDLPEPIALRPADLKMWREAVKTCTAKLDPEERSADALLAMMTEHFRLAILAKGRELKTPRDIIEQKSRLLTEQQLTGAFAPELLPEREELLERASKYAAAEGMRAQLTTAKARIESIDAELKTAGDDVTRRDAEHATAMTELEEKHADLVAARKMAFEEMLAAARGVAGYEALAGSYTKAIERGDTACLICRSELGGVEHITKTRDSFQAKVDDRKAKEAQAKNGYELLGRELDALEAEIDRVQLDYRVAKESAKGKNAHLARSFVETQAEIRDLEKRLATTPSAYSGPSIETLTAEIQAIKAGLSAREDVRREGQKVAELEEEARILKVLQGEAQSMQKMVMQRVAKVASDEVSLGMLDGRRAKLDPNTMEWSIIRKDGQEFGPFGALCGTEKTSLLLGLCAAWTRGSPLRVALFDDEDMVGLSTKGIIDFYATCEALADRGDFTQVIVVNNRPELVPSRERGGNWRAIIRGPAVVSVAA